MLLCSSLPVREADRYFELFRPLIQLNQDTKLVEVFEDCEIAGKGRGLISILYSTDNLKVPAKNIRNKIDLWSEKLDKELEAVRYNPDQLSRLQEIARKVFSDRKTVLLKDKLEQEGFISLKMIKSLERFDLLLHRLMTVPKLELSQPFSLMRRGTIVNRQRPMFGSVGFISHFCQFAPLQNVFPKAKAKKTIILPFRKTKSASDLLDMNKDHEKPIKRPRNLSGIRKEIETKHREIMDKKMALEISIYHPKWGKGWDEKLIARINVVNDQRVLMALGPELETMQMLALINYLIHDQSQEWKLVYLLGTLNHAIFVEVLHSFSPDILRLANDVLKRSSLIRREWFEEAFTQHRDGFIETCNRMKEKIDALACTFRQDLKGYLLTSADLKCIGEFKDNITLRMKGIEDYLRPLIDGVIWHPNTRSVLFEQAIEEYKTLLKRLEESSDIKRLPPGSLWPIIYGNAFVRARLEDDDDAILAFGDWSLTSIEEYRRVGLFGDITDEQWDLLKKREKAEQNKEQDKFKIFNLGGIEHLKKLGIVLIEDWKKVRIFNLTMLEEFLKRKENQEKLTQWTLEALKPMNIL
jgi:hypothetical protein